MRKYILLVMAIMLVSIFVPAQHGVGASSNFNTSGDTFFAKWSGDSNQSGQGYMYVRGSSNANYYDRAALRFDISSLGNVKVQSASLNMYLYTNMSLTGETMWAYKISRSNWSLSTSSWNHYTGTTHWSVAGGDYVTSNPSGGSKSFGTGTGWCAWDITAIAADAVLNCGGQIDIIVKMATEQLSKQKMGLFYSAETGGGTIPYVTITFLPIVSIDGAASSSVVTLDGVTWSGAKSLDGVQ